jgi:adenine phosphoribosyltransferase
LVTPLKETTMPDLTSPVDLRNFIRTVENFPRPGISFFDITPILRDRRAFAYTIDRLSEPFVGQNVDIVVSMEARGFIFGPAVAYRLAAGFAPVRKVGKLPYETLEINYNLEYGTDTIEIHRDAVLAGERVLIMDDVLATGGTAGAVVNLVNRMQGTIVATAFVIELADLGGRKALGDVPVVSLLEF